MGRRLSNCCCCCCLLLLLLLLLLMLWLLLLLVFVAVATASEPCLQQTARATSATDVAQTKGRRLAHSNQRFSYFGLNSTTEGFVSTWTSPTISSCVTSGCTNNRWTSGWVWRRTSTCGGRRICGTILYIRTPDAHVGSGCWPRPQQQENPVPPEPPQQRL